MSELERFRELIERLRPIAEASHDKPLSPLAQLWARELDGTGRHTLRAAYRAGGLPLVVSGVAAMLDSAPPGMTPSGVIAALEEIATMEANADKETR